MKRILCILLAVLILALCGCAASSRKEITVSFDGNSYDAEEVPKPCTIFAGQPVPGQPYPIRPGYAFHGWCTDPEGREPFDFHKKVKKPLTLYASWISADDPAVIPDEETLAEVRTALDSFSGLPTDGKQPEEILDAAEARAEQLYKDGTVTYYVRGDRDVYMEFSCGLCYLHRLPGDPTDASSGTQTSIISVEPDGTRRRHHGIPDSLTPITNSFKESLPGTVSHAYDRSVHITNMDALKDLAKQDFARTSMLLWDGHGYYNSATGEFYLVTGIPDEWQMSLTLDSLWERKFAIINVEAFSDDKDHAFYRMVALRPRYWRQFAIREDGLVFLAACDSLKPQCCTQVHNFLVGDEGIVFGSTDTIKTAYIQEMMHYILLYMGGGADNSYHTAAEALEFAHQKMEEKYFTNTETHITNGQYQRTSFSVCSEKTVGDVTEYTMAFQDAQVVYEGPDDYILVPSVDLTLVPDPDLAVSGKLPVELVFETVSHSHAGIENQIKEDRMVYSTDISPEPTPLRISEVPTGAVKLRVYCCGQLLDTLDLEIPRHQLVRAGEIPLNPLMTSSNLSNVIEYNGDLYYWKYEANQFRGRSSYWNGTFPFRPDAQIPLVCLHADGTEETLLTIPGLRINNPQDNPFTIQGGCLYYSAPASNGDSIDLMRYCISDKETQRVGRGLLRWVCPELNLLVTSDSQFIRIIDPDNPKDFLTAEGSFLGGKGTTIYYEAKNLIGTTALYASDIRTIGRQELFSTGHDTECIRKLVLADDRIYASYGALAGTGWVFQGGNICSVNYDGTGLRVETQIDQPGFYVVDGQVRQDGPAEGTFFYDSDRKFMQDKGSIYHIAPDTGIPELLFSPRELEDASLGSSRDPGFATGWAELSDDGKDAWGLFYCSILGGWEMRPTRTLGRIAMLHKDMETGEVRIVSQSWS